jgi:hypothetical protein
MKVDEVPIQTRRFMSFSKSELQLDNQNQNVTSIELSSSGALGGGKD